MKALAAASLASSLAVWGCGSTVLDTRHPAERDASSDAPLSPDADSRPPSDSALPPRCVLTESSSIPHVRLVITRNDCVFTLVQARAGISIPYDVIIDEDVPGFRPVAPYPYGPDVSGLDLGELLEEHGQRYCLCDEGLPYAQCPLEDGGTTHTYPCAPVTLRKGTYHRAFTWDGVNWTGPSDTGNPKGPPFPPGDYTLTLSTAPGTLYGVDAGGGDARAPTPVSAVTTFLVRLTD